MKNTSDISFESAQTFDVKVEESAQAPGTELDESVQTFDADLEVDTQTFDAGMETDAQELSADMGTVLPISSGTDLSLGLLSAKVGDLIRVKAVDDNGAPTAWEAYAPPGWEKLIDLTLDEAGPIVRDDIDSAYTYLYGYLWIPKSASATVSFGASAFLGATIYYRSATQLTTYSYAVEIITVNEIPGYPIALESIGSESGLGVATQFTRNSVKKYIAENRLKIKLNCTFPAGTTLVVFGKKRQGA